MAPAIFSQMMLCTVKLHILLILDVIVLLKFVQLAIFDSVKFGEQVPQLIPSIR